MSKTRDLAYNIGECDWRYQTWLMFCQAQHMGVGQFSAHSVAGKDYVHYLQHSQNKILVRILPNSTLILDLFMLPEVRNFSNLKPVIS